MALVRSDPFREVDRLFQSLYGPGGSTKPLAMPMDAYRQGNKFFIELDLPGVSPDSTDITVEGDTLTIKAERPQREMPEGVELVVAERPRGTFVRQILLGENLDTDSIEARYETGVLSLAIPVAEHAQPRRIQIQHEEVRSQLDSAGANV